MAKNNQPEFRGFELLDKELRIKSFACRKCEEACTVLMLYREGELISFWNDRCGRYSSGELGL